MPTFFASDFLKVGGALAESFQVVAKAAEFHLSQLQLIDHANIVKEFEGDLAA